MKEIVKCLSEKENNVVTVKEHSISRLRGYLLYGEILKLRRYVRTVIVNNG
jgi:hypothetical protein